MEKRGILFVISGPSGAGKGAVLAEVFLRADNLHYSISATTRPQRETETQGKDYHFVDNKRFDEMIGNGELLEYVEKFENRYGTLKEGVETMLDEGKDVVLEIETIGAENVRRLMPECISVFIAPPGLTELWKRLTKRGTETEGNKKLRFETSRTEMQSAYNYNYIVINDKVERCADKVVAVITAERLKVGRNRAVIQKIIES